VITPSHSEDAATSADDVQRRYGDRWQIELEDLGVWSAVRRTPDGRHIRCLVARTTDELAAKLETADVVEP